MIIDLGTSKSPKLAIPRPSTFLPKQIALVGCSLNPPKHRDSPSRLYQQLHRQLSAAGVDTILWSLADKRATWRPNYGASPYTGLEWALTSAGVPDSETMQIWSASARTQYRFKQFFATSTDPHVDRQQLLTHFKTRVFGKTFVLLCGESNIIRTHRGTDDIEDDYGFRSRLHDEGIELIFNPLHTFMRRPEMKWKRAALSRPNRTVVSVWNWSLNHAPWTVFRNGRDVSREVEPVTLSGRAAAYWKVGVFTVS